jgi:hypothetical protein
MTSTAETDLFNVLVRMVTPMRREFGWTFDVQQARSDAVYARQVAARARTSQAERLRGYAEFVDSLVEEPVAPAAKVEPAAPVPGVKRDLRAAARRLIDAVGPMGEPLAMQLEKARDGQTVQRCLDA